MRELPVFLLVLGTYLIFTGSAKPYDLVTGVLVALVISVLTSKYLVERPGKALNPLRWLWALIYFLWYMIVAEVKAHIDVIVRIFTGNVKPAIIKVPVNLSSDYSKMLVANSITNTPGTVVVDVDGEYLYVNWIYATTDRPEEARERISKEFEKFASKIFE
ncbi:Na+/H+ antiporter subunit E [Pyrococcus kukulkanii]|uniref:Na+/H+ antiporter subunit E n=1 Tax=Pyrococcus kukulkanii TaxID=1609559 RepID=UPI00356376F7